MQLNVQIPASVPPGGYIPIVLQVGDASTTPAAVWIAISGGLILRIEERLVISTLLAQVFAH